MANEIVKYGNQLNTVPLRRFNAREMNLLLTVVSRVTDKGTSEVVLSFDTLKRMSKYSAHEGERFVKELDSMYEKLISLNAYTDDGHVLSRFVAFDSYMIDRDKETVTISVSPKFKYMFNELKQWTRFSLLQFAELRSTYAKTMFRLLKQYRTVGKYKVSMEDFRALLDIPTSYRVDNINDRVLRPIKEELSPIFKGLAVRKLRGGRGGKVVGYSFTFKQETRAADDFSKGESLDLQAKLSNIANNSELTGEAERRAIARVKGERLPSKPKRSKKPSAGKKRPSKPSSDTPDYAGMTKAELVAYIEKHRKK